MGWYRQDGDRWILSLQVQPGARVSAIQGLHGDSLKVRIAAPPVEGAANMALQKFLAACLGVRARDIEILAGVSSRAKRVAVRGTNDAALAQLAAG